MAHAHAHAHWTYLTEAALQRALDDVVLDGAHVDVAVAAARALRVDGPHAAKQLGELQPRKVSQPQKRAVRTYFGLGDLLVVLQRVPGGDAPVLLAAREQGAFGQHHHRAHALAVRLVLHLDEVGAVRVHAVDGDEAVAVARDDVAVLLELQRGDHGARGLQVADCLGAEAARGVAARLTGLRMSVRSKNPSLRRFQKVRWPLPCVIMRLSSSGWNTAPVTSSCRVCGGIWRVH